MRKLSTLGYHSGKAGSTKVSLSNLSREKMKLLSSLRVIQKNLVYVIGLSPELAYEDVLRKPEYMGQYGQVQKVVVNNNKVYNDPRDGPSYSAYVTYATSRETSIAILVRLSSDFSL